MSTNQPVESIVAPTSSFPDLFHTHLPSLSEASLIQSTLTNARSDIVLIDNVISMLSHRRETLHEYIWDHAAILSPIRRLPPEILGEIFKYCLPAYNERAANADIRATMLPSHVCGHWRRVAIATPMLWSMINMNAYEENVESITELVATWFSRTRGYPLSFWLQGGQVQPIIDAILPYCDICVYRYT
jgi:hypothetical protein